MEKHRKAKGTKRRACRQVALLPSRIQSMRHSISCTFSNAALDPTQLAPLDVAIEALPQDA
jgi:hypothetical protein